MKLRKNLYILFLILSVVMTLFTVIASVSGTSGTSDSIFKSVWTVFLLAAYVFIQVICLFNLKPKKFTVYRCGFYALHIGLVLFLIGSFFYYVSGDKLTVSVPVNDSAVYSQIKRDKPDSDGNNMLKLDFSFGVSDFKVERYPADEDGQELDKHYEATLLIMPEGTRELSEKSLTVNKPYRYGGWKFYLMNYDRTTEDSVQLMLKHDPAEYVSLAGIWLAVIGAFLMCLRFKVKAVDDCE